MKQLETSILNTQYGILIEELLKYNCEMYTNFNYQSNMLDLRFDVFSNFYQVVLQLTVTTQQSVVFS